METVLDTYAQPYDASRPVICFDEKSYQLLDHVREPRPPVPGIPARVDHEYKRCGTVNFFVLLTDDGKSLDRATDLLID